MQKRQAVLSRNPTGSISLSFMLIKYLKIFLIRITYEYQVFLHIKISKLPVPCHQCIADILMLLRNLGGHAFLAHRRHKAADGREMCIRDRSQAYCGISPVVAVSRYVYRSNTG